MDNLLAQGKRLVGLVWRPRTRSKPREYVDPQARPIQIRAPGTATPTLLGIPTEMRLEIFKHLFHDSPIQLNGSTVLVNHIAPPITQVCRLLRRDALEAYDNHTELAIVTSPRDPPHILPTILSRLGNQQVRRFFFAWPRRFFTVHLELTAFPTRAAKKFDEVIPSIAYAQCRYVGEDYMIRVKSRRTENNNRFHEVLASQLAEVLNDILEQEDNQYLSPDAILRIADSMTAIAVTELTPTPARLLLWSS